MEERQSFGEATGDGPAWPTPTDPAPPAFPTQPQPYPGRQPGPAPQQFATPPTGRAIGPASGAIDRMHKSDTDRALFAALPAADRAAAYLNSIRKMMIFFVVITVIGIILSVVFTILIIHSADQTTSTFGQ
jgi:hypothetical protein